MGLKEFFIKKINKLRNEVERWKRYEQRGSYAYWYQRRQRKALNQLKDTVQLVNQYVQSPYHAELMGTVKAAIQLYAGNDYFRLHPDYTEFARDLKDYINPPKEMRGKIAYKQTYFPSE